MSVKTNERTLELLERYRNGDRSARDEIVTNYTPLVHRIASRLRKSREPQEDLAQIGFIGLLTTIEKFQPSRGKHFTSLAIPEIWGAMLNFLRDHGSLMKVPRQLRRNAIDLQKLEPGMAMALGYWPGLEVVGKEMNLTAQEIEDVGRYGQQSDPRSLDEPLTNLWAADEGDLTLLDFTGQDDQGFDEVDTSDEVRAHLDRLDERSRRIVVKYFWNNMTQREIGKAMNFSQMQISRILAKALQTMRGENPAMEKAA